MICWRQSQLTEDQLTPPLPSADAQPCLEKLELLGEVLPCCTQNPRVTVGGIATFNQPEGDSHLCPRVFRCVLFERSREYSLFPQLFDGFTEAPVPLLNRRNLFLERRIIPTGDYQETVEILDLSEDVTNGIVDRRDITHGEHYLPFETTVGLYNILLHLNYFYNLSTKYLALLVFQTPLSLVPLSNLLTLL
jgi:hypothetical protein